MRKLLLFMLCYKSFFFERIGFRYNNITINMNKWFLL